MGFTDLRNFKQMLPEDKQESINATFDTIEASVKGFKVGAKVVGRTPYSRLELQDYNTPFHFELTLNFDEAPEGRTDFSINLRADLNLMMKAMIGGKIKDALDRIVDGIVAVSEGRVPKGMDPSDFPGNINF